MPFQNHPVKGIHRHLLDADLHGEPLHLHISKVAPGQRSHPPHQHDGIEAIYMFAGTATLEIGDEGYTLNANESIVFNPQKLHGLFNSGEQPMRYMVIIYQEAE